MLYPRARLFHYITLTVLVEGTKILEGGALSVEMGFLQGHRKSKCDRELKV